MPWIAAKYRMRLGDNFKYPTSCSAAKASGTRNYRK